MSARIGTCTGCGAQYGNIPPTVTATKVRCRKCGGEVVIPPLEASPDPSASATPPAPTPTESGAPTAEKSEGSGLQAKPIGDAKPKGNGERPASAAPVDRAVARPETPKPAPPKKPAPPPPPKKKAVPPPPPVKKPAPPPPPVKKAAPPPPAKKAAPPPAKKVEPPKKDPDKAAALMAQLKKRKDAGSEKVQAQKAASSSAASAGDKDPAKAADLMAKLKAKKAGGQAGASAVKKTPAPVAKKPVAPPLKKRPAAGGAGNRRSRERSEERHHHAPAKKGAPLVMTLVSVVALGVIGYGLWYFMTKEPVQPEPTVSTAAEQAGDSAPAAAGIAPPEAPPADAASETTPEAEDATPATEDGAAENASAPAADSGGAEAAAPPPEQPVGEDPEWTPPAAGEKIQYVGYRNPESLKLELVTPLAKWDQTSDEDWSFYTEDVAEFLADGGASSIRAKNRLVEAGRGAFPAIVNGMLTTDWSDNYNIVLCNGLNKILVEMGHGTNFGWDSVDVFEEGSDEWKEAVMKNKKVVAAWYNAWLTQFSVDDKRWEGFAKKYDPNAKKGEEEKAKPTPPVGRDFDD